MWGKNGATVRHKPLVLVALGEWDDFEQMARTEQARRIGASTDLNPLKYDYVQAFINLRARYEGQTAIGDIEVNVINQDLKKTCREWIDLFHGANICEHHCTVIFVGYEESEVDKHKQQQRRRSHKSHGDLKVYEGGEIIWSRAKFSRKLNAKIVVHPSTATADRLMRDHLEYLRIGLQAIAEASDPEIQCRRSPCSKLRQKVASLFRVTSKTYCRCGRRLA